jgi:hypothetical protein
LFASCDILFVVALRECRVTFRDVRDILHSVALGLKRIREQQFVMEDLADPVTVELVTSTQHKVSLKKVSLKEVIDWMSHAGGTSPKETAMKARLRRQVWMGNGDAAVDFSRPVSSVRIPNNFCS